MPATSRPHQDPLLNEVLNRISHEQPQSIARLTTLLKIPSISANPVKAGACVEAAEWIRAELEGLGFTASVRPTARHPAVVAHHPGPGGDVATVLFYGHYDVQPPEPLELWTTPAFEPRIAEGPHGAQIFARGASDNKGQIISWLDALRAFRDVQGGPPVAVTILVEGEEEIGSPSLAAFLAENVRDLAADIALAIDASQWTFDIPALVTRLRGMAYTQIDLKGADRDLHSGLYGGSAANPLTLLSRILAALHDDNGAIQIPGFYDGVEEISDEERRLWQALEFDERRFLGDVGLSDGIGENDRTALERLWSRPTAEVNGIWGGYMGEGSKTVLPAEAHAKVSFRLVPGQDPKRIAGLFEAFVKARLPADVSATIQLFSNSPATLIRADSPFVKAARQALQDEFGREAVLVGTGGTLPVINHIKHALGIDSLLYGWALEDDNPHSPDEKFELRNLERGTRSHARILDAIARMDRS